MRAPSRRLLRDYGIAISVAIVVALMIRFFVLEAYRIPSPAMKPTLEPGDTIFVAKWPFGMRLPGSAALTAGRLPRLGEIVVFSFPEEPRRDYIKRVLGLPGDTVAIKAGHVSLNGQTLAVPGEKPTAPCGHERLSDGSSYEVCWEPPALSDFGPEKVADGQVFVLGDLRSQGTGDTKNRKTWGLVPAASIKGKAMWIWLSVEPQAFDKGMTTGWFPAFRFDRMFRAIR
jgi:signal peptidase I